MSSDIRASAPLAPFRHAVSPASDGRTEVPLLPVGASRHQRLRTIGARVLCMVAGLLVPLLLAELFFRFAGAAAPGDYQTAELTAASDLFERQNLANRAGWKRSPEFETYVRVNSHGLRGPEIPY